MFKRILPATMILLGLAFPAHAQVGKVTCLGLPALTGDTTSSAGGCATSTTKLTSTDDTTTNATYYPLFMLGTGDAGFKTSSTKYSWNPSTGTLNVTVLQQNGTSLATVATSGSAADLGSGTLPAARIPTPGASSLGGVQSKDCSSGSQFLQKINTDGTETCASPSAGGILAINGYINGFTLSNDGSTPNTVLDIAAGYAADSTDAVMITGTAFTKKTGASWAAGSGGYMCSVTTSTWYHVFAIINSGSFDVYCDTSPSAANKPASTTAFRYIGSFLTDSSSHIIAFTQYGQNFVWSGSGFADVSNGHATVATAVTLHTPLGFVTFPYGRIYYYVSADLNDQGQFYSGTNASWSLFIDPQVLSVPQIYPLAPYLLYTNTSSQISYNGQTTSDATYITTQGYINPRVAPNF